MKSEWIVREGRPSLLLFFNGWGMDRNVADWMRASTPDPGSHDLLLLYDYRDLSLPEGLAAEMAGYRAVDLAAWSLGVWAATGAGLGGIRRAVALNGTTFPVDDARGIPPAVFRGTLEQWSDAGRARFERRMFSGSELDPRLDEVRSRRSSDEQREELRAIDGILGGAIPFESPSWRYDRAFVGGRDLIFLPERQLAAWQGTDCTVIDGMPHFPFFHLSGWQEVLS